MQSWQSCLDTLQQALSSQEFMTWIQPLEAKVEGTYLYLIAPNHFISNWVNDKYFNLISECLLNEIELKDYSLKIIYGSLPENQDNSGSVKRSQSRASVLKKSQNVIAEVKYENSDKKIFKDKHKFVSGLNPKYTFSRFVCGQSNQLAHAAAVKVSKDPGLNNPLFIYGGVGLGKTHLMHAVGHALKAENKDIKVLHVYSSDFAQKMSNAVRLKSMNEFKQYYRSVDVLLLDDVQFFAGTGKDKFQEEIFHTLNSLLDNRQQIIMTCDSYPKDIAGIEDRLKSRLGWGLTVGIDPPELETRVAILKKKAEESYQYLSDESAFFIAQKIRSHVRDLEGALSSVFAYANFKDKEISIPIIKEALKDLLASQDRQIFIDNIQRTVAEYYKIKVSELCSKSRQRRVVRPRQIAMALCKELTSHSLPQIGDAFGGRDHTTVIHACNTMGKLKEQNPDIMEDYKILIRILTT